MAVMDYQTRDGLADYGFSIEFKPDVGWRVYIIFEPFFLGENGSLKLPYQSIDHNGRRYVNWLAKLDNLADARTVAALWAELSQRFLCIQGERRVTPASPRHLGDSFGVDQAGSKHPYSSSVIPHPSITVKSPPDSRERKRSVRGADEVA